MVATCSPPNTLIVYLDSESFYNHFIGAIFAIYEISTSGIYK